MSTASPTVAPPVTAAPKVAEISKATPTTPLSETSVSSSSKGKSKRKTAIIVVSVLLVLIALALVFVFVILPRLETKKPPPTGSVIAAELQVSAPEIASVSVVDVSSTAATGVSNLSATITMLQDANSSDDWTASILIYLDSGGTTLAQESTDYTISAAGATLTTNTGGSPSFQGTGSLANPVVLTLSSFNKPLFVGISALDTTVNSSSQNSSTLIAIYPVVVAQGQLSATPSSVALETTEVSVSYTFQSQDSNLSTNLATAYVNVTDTSSPPTGLLNAPSNAVILGPSTTGYTIDPTTNTVLLTIGTNTTVTSPAAGDTDYTASLSSGDTLTFTNFTKDSSIVLVLQTATVTTVASTPVQFTPPAPKVTLEVQATIPTS